MNSLHLLLAAAAVLTISCQAKIDTGGGPAPATPDCPSIPTEGQPKSLTVMVKNEAEFSVTPVGTSPFSYQWKRDNADISGATFALYSIASVSSADSGATFRVTVGRTGCPSVTSDPATLTVIEPGEYVTPGPASGEIVVRVDSHTSHPISPYIYGINFQAADNIDPRTGDPISSGGTWGDKVLMDRIPLNRWGGNQFTAFNWETGYINYGRDWQWQNGTDYVVDEDVAGSAVGHLLDIDRARPGTSTLLTVPLIGFVAKDGSSQAALQKAPSDTTPLGYDQLKNWFHEMLAKNPGGATATPNLNDTRVYADDYAKWIATSYPGAETSSTKRVMLGLDNEPDYWGFAAETHAEIRGFMPSRNNSIPVGAAELIDKTIATSSAIKDVMPNVDIFGGVFGGIGGMYSIGWIGDYPPDWYGYRTFLDAYAARLDEASRQYGRPLVDALDWHHYPLTGGDNAEVGQIISNDGLQQTQAIVDMRVQAPRALWDPDFFGHSWEDYFERWADIAKELPQFENKGAAFIRRNAALLAQYPMGPQKQAITEYFFGRGGDISNTIAHADVFGILAREQVYAATFWPFNSTASQNGGQCIIGPDCLYPDLHSAFKGSIAAFNAYLSYDGGGAKFGDVYVDTAVTDTNRPTDPLPFVYPQLYPSSFTVLFERVTAYCSTYSSETGKMTCVAINKRQDDTLTVGFQITHIKQFGSIAAYRITGTNGTSMSGGVPSGYSVSGPSAVAAPSFSDINVFYASLPPQSVTIFVLQ